MLIRVKRLNCGRCMVLRRVRIRVMGNGSEHYGDCPECGPTDWLRLPSLDDPTEDVRAESTIEELGLGKVVLDELGRPSVSIHLSEEARERMRSERERLMRQIFPRDPDSPEAQPWWNEA